MATQINMIFARKEVCQGDGLDSDHIINATIRMRATIDMNNVVGVESNYRYE